MLIRQRQEVLADVFRYKQLCSSCEFDDFDGKITEKPYGELIRYSYQLVQLSNTLDECREAYLVTPLGSKPNKIALSKWTKYALKLAERARTPVEAREAQHNSPPDSEAQRIALVRRKKLCLTPAQAWEEYVNSPLGSEERDDFIFLYIKLCDTVDQLEYVLGGLSHGSVARIAVKEKIKQLQTRADQKKGSEVGCLE